MRGPDRLRTALSSALFAGWFGLLLLPSATVFSTAHTWDAHPLLLLSVTAGFFAFAWLLAGSRWFFILTLPFAFLGLVVMAADVMRGANLVEIALVAGRVDPREARDALAPYALPLGITFALLAACVVYAFRRPLPMPRARVRLAAAALLAVALGVPAFVAPATVLRAWPLNVASLEVAAALGRRDFIATALPWAPVDPRARGTSWSAHRDAAITAARETYVVVIGESVRADRLAACGGRAPLALPDEAIVYCDVTSGSTSTHTAVPLLVSREMPGGSLRVSTDTTVLHAFGEVGFRTYWLGVQGPTVAWPDADVTRYAQPLSTDRRDLLPLLRAALADPAPRKVIVLHSYDAHFNYCDRYDATDAPFPVDCAALGPLPTPQKRDRWLDAYDNAVAETLAFLRAVHGEVEGQGGESFLVYTSDHGENLVDDERGLFAHSLKELSRYDTRVPMIFWPGKSWRESHAAQAHALADHRGVRAMHADLVPTVLGAAGIRYADPRTEVADLTREAPPARTRWVSRRLGEAVDGDTLR